MRKSGFSSKKEKKLKYNFLKKKKKKHLIKQMFKNIQGIH